MNADNPSEAAATTIAEELKLLDPPDRDESRQAITDRVAEERADERRKVLAEVEKAITHSTIGLRTQSPASAVGITAAMRAVDGLRGTYTMQEIEQKLTLRPEQRRDRMVE